MESMKHRIIRYALILLVLTPCIACGKDDKTSTKIEPYNKDKQEQIAEDVNKNKKEISSYGCKEIDEITDFKNVNCVTYDILNRQAEMRANKAFAAAHDYTYTQDDVKNYYKTEMAKSGNKMVSKRDIPYSIESEVLLVGLDNYAKTHEREYLLHKIYEKEVDNRINSLSEQDKKDIIGQYAAIYKTIGMTEENANKKALKDGVSANLNEELGEEYNSILEQQLTNLFIEMQPDVYNKLPNNEQADNYENEKKVEPFKTEQEWKEYSDKESNK